MDKSLLEQLKQTIVGEVTDNAKQLDQYSRDASVFEVTPAIIVRPKGTGDLKRLVKWVAAHKAALPHLSLTARAGGTDMSGGPLSDSIVVDFTAHFRRIGKLSRNTITAEPGAWYRDFEKHTLAHNLILPSYTSSKEICTIGGMAANNAGGEKSMAYGKTDRYVEEVSMVLSDGNEYTFRSLTIDELEDKKTLPNLEGEIYRQLDKLLEQNYELLQKARPTVTKNSAGYALWDVWDHQRFDVCKLIVGSQGTLGLITKLKFRLVPLKKYSELVVIPLNDMASLGDVVTTIAAHQPECFESYDDHTARLAVKYLPSMLRRMVI